MWHAILCFLPHSAAAMLAVADGIERTIAGDGDGASLMSGFNARARESASVFARFASSSVASEASADDEGLGKSALRFFHRDFMLAFLIAFHNAARARTRPTGPQLALASQLLLPLPVRAARYTV